MKILSIIGVCALLAFSAKGITSIDLASTTASFGDIVTYYCPGDIMYVAKIENGRCKLYNARTGSYQRTVGESGAVSAQVQGDIVAVTYANGKVKIYSCKSGSYQRTI